MFCTLPWKSRAFNILFIATVIVYTTLIVWQARNRKPWNDEAMCASAGYTLATEGHLAIPSFDDHDPSLRGIHQRMYYTLPLQMLVMAGWYKLIGFGLLKTRVLSMLWTALFFSALYSMMKLLSEQSGVALLAVALTAFDYQIMSAAAFGRYDSMVAALGFSAYAVFLRLRERHFTAAVTFSNACITAAGLTHPNGLVYFLGLWFLIIYYDRSRISVQHLALAAVPYLIGGVAYGWYILQDTAAFQSQLFGNTGHRVGLFHPWDNIKKEILLRWIRPYGLGWHEPGHMTPLVRLKAIAILGYLAGIFGCLVTSSIRKHAGYRVLLLLSAIHAAYITLYEGMKFNYYLIHLLPFYLSLLAVFLSFVWKCLPTHRMATAGAVALLAGVAAGGILMKARVDDMHSSYEPAVAYVKHNAGPNDLIFASCSLGFKYGFKPNLIDDATLGYYSGWQPRFIVMEEVYEDNLVLLRAQPKIYEHVRKLMSDYQIVYEKADYKIYERISRGTQFAAKGL